jgi:hypothetical protein
MRESSFFARLPMILFGGAVVWFALWWWWESSRSSAVSAEASAQLVLLGSGLLTCVGMSVALVGLLPGNRARWISLLGVVLNGTALVFLLRSFLLVGL